MDEQYIGPIRRGMHAAGIPIEFSKGEAWHGQHEINIRYADAVTAADRHTIYKNGVKEIAFLNEISATFMAKPSEKDIGSSCHVHTSLVGGNGRKRLRQRQGRGERHLPPLPRRHAREHPRHGAVRGPVDQLLQALRRRVLGPDLRLVGPRQPHLRLPDRRRGPVQAHRVPHPRRRRQPLSGDGGAAGRRASTGSRTRPIPGPELKGNAYEAGKAEAFPSSLREAVDLWEKSKFAKKAFGEGVHKHYLNYGRLEQSLFDQVVTDYERTRMFERG